MKFFSQPKSSVITCLLGGVSAFLLGCVVSVGNSTDAGTMKQCGDLLTNSHQVGDQCYCDVGYNWCTSDPNDYECCKVPAKDPASCDSEHNVVQDGECYCEEGYTWCSDDPNDYSCCASSQGTTGGTTTDGTTDGTTEGTTGTTTPETTTDGTTGGDCVFTEPPAGCEPGTFFCTNHQSEECSQGSQYYYCDGGNWVEEPNMDPNCTIEGWDFAYGCIDDGNEMKVDFVCGSGPGTPCSNEPDACADLDTHTFCLYGKLSSESCSYQCTEVGDGMGVTYDYGECGEQRGSVQCLCCDFDDPNCGGGGTGTDTDTDTGGDTDTDTGTTG